MLVTGIFSFSHNVFISSQNKLFVTCILFCAKLFILTSLKILSFDEELVLAGNGSNFCICYCVFRWTTNIILSLKADMRLQTQTLAARFNDIHPSLLLFLNRLREITIENKVRMVFYCSLLDTVPLYAPALIDLRSIVFALSVCLSICLYTKRKN